MQFAQPALGSKLALMILVFCCHGWEFADDPWKLLNDSVWQLDISILKLKYVPVTESEIMTSSSFSVIPTGRVTCSRQ